MASRYPQKLPFAASRPGDKPPLPAHPGGMDWAGSEIESAAALVAAHGERARQKVVDRIVAAIRQHDIETAKMWDRIGTLVDESLFGTVVRAA